MLDNLTDGLATLNKSEVLDTVKSRLNRGEDALSIVEEARRGMTKVGDRFQEGTLYLAEMLLAAEIFKEALEVLKPHLAKGRPSKFVGKVVLATPTGDIHDLGKNIFSTLLETQGFAVIDLGVDVAPSAIVEKVRQVRPHFVGFSALITTAFAGMKETVEILINENLRNELKILVGGGVSTPLLKEHIGADFQTTDAMMGVNYCLETMRDKGRRLDFIGE
jgi:methanogenic corrinoid protein MtbC1